MRRKARKSRDPIGPGRIENRLDFAHSTPSSQMPQRSPPQACPPFDRIGRIAKLERQQRVRTVANLLRQLPLQQQQCLQSHAI